MIPYFYLIISTIALSLALEPVGSSVMGMVGILFILRFCLTIYQTTDFKKTVFGTLFFSFFLTLFAFTWVFNSIQNITGANYFTTIILYIVYSLLSFYKIGIIFLGTYILSRYGKQNIYIFLFIYFPILFVLSDWFSPMVFPVYWGDFFRNQIFLRQIVRFGVETFGFVMVLVVVSMYWLYSNKTQSIKAKIPYFCLILFPIFLNIYFLFEPYQTESQIRLALVQPNIPFAKREEKENFESMRSSLQNFYDIGLEAIQKSEHPLDLLVFPESSVPFLGTLPSDHPSSTYNQSFEEVVFTLKKNNRTNIVFNELVWDGGSRNSLSLLTKNSDYIKRKYKQKLMPFGEYIPLGDLFPILLKIFPESSAHIPGNSGEFLKFVSNQGKEISFFGIVCYEIMFPDLIQSNLSQTTEPKFLLNLTNDSWFESTRESEQHAGAGKLRAIEMGIPLVRAALNGLTQGYDPYGRELLANPPMFQKAIFFLDLPLSRAGEPTFYRRFGAYPLRITLILILIFTFFYSNRQISTEENQK
ncbi:apolipoprotein N-acyltransferase [Leptospira sp. 96542]|nr:apolipoprotein N-acyltransferase [Leptospira sp. 96542]